MKYQSVPLLVAIVCAGLFAQQPKTKPASAGTTSDQDVVPVRKVDLTNGKIVSGVPDASSIGYPASGSTSGAILVEMYDDSKQNPDYIASDLFFITVDGKATNIQRKLPDGMARLQAKSAYAGDSIVGSLVVALPKKSDSDAGVRRFRFFVAISKSDGTADKLLRLDLRFEPRKIAIFDSGRILVAGFDTLNKVPALAILESDGTLLRSITIDNRPLEKSKSLKEIYKTDAASDSDSLTGEVAANSAMFVPYGSKILLYVPGTNIPVHILGEGGEENTVQIALPAGYLIETILPTAKDDTWVVRGQSTQSFSQLHSEGVISSPQQALFEVDPSSGSTLSRLDVTGLFPGSVISAVGKRLIGFHRIGDVKDVPSPPAWVLSVQNR